MRADCLWFVFVAMHRQLIQNTFARFVESDNFDFQSALAFANHDFIDRRHCRAVPHMGTAKI